MPIEIRELIVESQPAQEAGPPPHAPAGPAESSSPATRPGEMARLLRSFAVRADRLRAD